MVAACDVDAKLGILRQQYDNKDLKTTQFSQTERSDIRGRTRVPVHYNYIGPFIQ